MIDLARIAPPLREKLDRILAAMSILGFPMLPTDGVRSLADQQRLFAQGRTTPGPIVTKCDGIIKPSNHQVKADGFGHAVDCAFVVGGRPSWDPKLPWGLYGAAGKALGLKWGGDFPAIDRPHLEMV